MKSLIIRKTFIAGSTLGVSYSLYENGAYVNGATLLGPARILEKRPLSRLIRALAHVLGIQVAHVVTVFCLGKINGRVDFATQSIEDMADILKLYAPWHYDSANVVVDGRHCIRMERVGYQVVRIQVKNLSGIDAGPNTFCDTFLNLWKLPPF